MNELSSDIHAFPPVKGTFKYPNNKSLTYMSPYYLLDKIRLHEWVYKHMLIKEIKSICDMTCNIGCESAYWAHKKPDCKIRSYEINKETYECAKHNLSYFKNISLYNQDSIYALNKGMSKYDLILLDAPWGESYDKFNNTCRLEMNGTDIDEIIPNIKIHTKNILLKVPRNWDHLDDYTKSNPFKVVYTRKSFYYYILISSI